MLANQSLLLEIIETHRIHPTAEEIFDLARSARPKISLGTVYRNLNQLVEMKKVRRISIPGEPDRFDNIMPHDHFICTHCGTIIDIGKINCHAENLPEGIVVEAYSATAYGLCATCLMPNCDQD